MSVANCDKTFPDIWTKAVAGELPTCTLAQYTAYLATNDGNCGFFGIDTAAKILRLPLVKDGNAVTQAMDSTELAKYYKSAFSNPHFHGVSTYDNNNGVFVSTTNPANIGSKKPSSVNTVGTWWNGSGGGGVNSSGFPTVTPIITSLDIADATAQVQIAQVRYPLIICLATTFVGDSAAAWEQFLGSLGAKANADLSNASSNIDFVISTATYSGSNGGTIGGTWSAEYRTWKSGRMEFLCNIVYGTPTANNPVFTFSFGIPFASAPTKAIVTAENTNTSHPQVSCSYSSLTATSIVLNSFGNSGSDTIGGLTVYVSGQRS
jgi:hypothetical protein